MMDIKKGRTSKKDSIMVKQKLSFFLFLKIYYLSLNDIIILFLFNSLFRIIMAKYIQL